MCITIGLGGRLTCAISTLGRLKKVRASCEHLREALILDWMQFHRRCMIFMGLGAVCCNGMLLMHASLAHQHSRSALRCLDAWDQEMVVSELQMDRPTIFDCTIDNSKQPMNFRKIMNLMEDFLVMLFS